jgi:signal transduction histidine kinase
MLSLPADGILVHPAGIGLDTDPTAAWLRPLQACRFEAVAPLRAPGVTDAAGETWLGLLALGKRVDEEIFHARDLEIIELIGQQAALFLLTAQQFERLRQVPRRVTEAQERERFKLAQELHDTIQQFLGRLPFYLEVSRRDIRSHPERSEALLQRCINDGEEAARTVRQIRGALAPIQLDTELTKQLENLLHRFRSRTEWVVEADIAPDVDARLSPEARHELFRVIQQALDNAAAHAKGASRVWVAVQGADGRVMFSVKDDGCGFTEAQRAQAEVEGHFGLRSMQARMASLGGELAVTSAPEGGVTVQGWLPVGRN